MMMECKKCKRPLPGTSKGKLCEHCKGKIAQSIKDGSKIIIAAGVSALSFAIKIATDRKSTPKK